MFIICLKLEIRNYGSFTESVDKNLTKRFFMVKSRASRPAQYIKRSTDYADDTD